MEGLGAHLRAIRKAKGYPLRKVRARSGLSIAFISDIERGIQSPSVRSMNKLAEAYGMTLSKLFEGFTIEAIPFVSF